jgi:hypothetical protein
MRREACFGVGLLAALLVYGLGWPSDAMARQVNKNPAKVAAKRAKAMGHAEVMQALRSAQTLLAGADHDYDGQRALAVKEVHKALAELGHKGQLTPLKSSSAATKTTRTGKGGNSESQATSDAQLRQAQQLLQTALQHISAAKHPRAAGNVKEAIGHINTALTIK